MSTLNSSLPKASNLRFTDKDGKNHHTLVYMSLGGTIDPKSSFACWQQNSYTYGFQAQYRIKARLTPDNELETGSTTKATAWKHLVPSWDQGTDIDNIDSFIGPKSSSKWRTYTGFDFAGMDFAEVGGFDKLEINLRVRSFSNSKKQHGVWETGTVTVKCRPEVAFHEIVAFHDGGLRFYLDLGGWKRGGSSFTLKSVKRIGDDTELLKEKSTDAVDGIGDEKNQEWPYAGFLGKHFDTAFKPGEQIHVEAEFKTCDDVVATISKDCVISGTSATVDAPVIEVEVFDEEAVIKVHAYKANQNEDWDTVTAWITCDGKRYEPCMSEGENDDDRTFTFAPPFDADIELHVGVSNDLYFNDSFPYTGIGSIPSKGRVFVNYTDGTHEQPEGGFYGPLLAVMQYDIEESTDSSRPHDTSHPLGRRRPMAFLGSGLERKVKVKGSIDATPDKRFERTAHSSLEDWRAFEEQQGLVLLRMPNGYCSHALCTGVSMDSDNSGLSKSVSLTFEEVDV